MGMHSAAFWAILFCFLRCCTCQIGLECETDIDCDSHQYCAVGYCHCNEGYIRNIDSCFKIRKHGQQCFFDLQCNDFRMLCAINQTQTLKSGHCVCDQYHEWNDTFSSCVPAWNVTDMLNQLQEANWTLIDDVNKAAHSVFFWQAVAGAAAVCAVLLITLGNMAYGCCCRNTHIRLENETTKEGVKECAVIGHAQGTYAPIHTEFTVAV